jgi:hypothetical protein
MKKQPTKKLVLNRESLLPLNDDGLKTAAGGATGGISICHNTCTC